ncbi:hypothetical protein BDF19DRAFT_456100 [Syncephalis fuscata]|nr:hypothetical protein BDF19DRAFT_456100 [Syncephalis fuscata]
MTRGGSETSIWAKSVPVQPKRTVSPANTKRNNKSNANKAGSSLRAKPSEEELQARMNRIRQQNQELLKRREAIEQDEAEFAKIVEHDREVNEQASALQKQKVERERKAMKEIRVEREENARRKLAASQLRAWDSEKSDGPNSRPGSTSPGPASKSFGSRGGRGSERSKSPFSPKFPARKVQSSNGAYLSNAGPLFQKDNTSRSNEHLEPEADRSNKINDGDSHSEGGQTPALEASTLPIIHIPDHQYDSNGSDSKSQKSRSRNRNNNNRNSSRDSRHKQQPHSSTRQSESSLSSAQDSPTQPEEVKSPISDAGVKSVDNMDDLFAWPPPDSERVAWGDEEVSVFKAGAEKSLWANK